MKYCTVFCMLFLFSFCDRINNRESKSDFEKCLLIVEEYYYYTGAINDTILARFYFANAYLETLSGIEAKYICADIPFYCSKKEYLDNISEWKGWYKENYQIVLNLNSDSINKIIIDKKIWWQDSTIVNIVFNSDI